MGDFVTVYDGLGYTTGKVGDADFTYHVLPRGVEVPSDVSDEKIKDWQNAEKYPPHGAIQKAGSRLGRLLSSAVPIAKDPADAQREIAAAAGEGAMLVDPAGDPSDETKSGVDPGVEEQRRVAAQLAGQTAQVPEALDDMSMTDLKTVADGLGVEYGGKTKKADLLDTIKAKQSGAPATPPQE